MLYFMKFTRSPSGIRTRTESAILTVSSRNSIISRIWAATPCGSIPEALEEAGRDLEALNGREFFYEYFEPTDPLGADKPNPKSHIAYAYATNLAILDDSGKLTDLYAAYDAGQVPQGLR